MKRYAVKRYWEVSDSVEVEAESEQEAIKKAHELTLTHGEYVPDSINSDEDVDIQEIKVSLIGVNLKDEKGYTLAELLVGIIVGVIAGGIALFLLIWLILAVIHSAVNG